MIEIFLKIFSNEDNKLLNNTPIITGGYDSSDSSDSSSNTKSSFDKFVSEQIKDVRKKKKLKKKAKSLRKTLNSYEATYGNRNMHKISKKRKIDKKMRNKK